MAVLSEEGRRLADAGMARDPERRSALLPLLYLVQAEQGLVTRDGMQEVAELLGLTTAEVEAVATYYTMFKKSPAGDWVLSVCTNLSCALVGGRHLYERARALVDDDEGISVEEVECLGACDAAPVGQVNYCNYDRLTEERLDELIERLRNGDPPEPSRGPKPVPHRRTARLLAGIREEAAGG